LAQEADLLHMTPNRTIASTSPYCLFGASTGEAIIYQASGTITINLSTIADSLDVTWYDPDDFVRTTGARVAGGSIQSLVRPNSRYHVLYLRAIATSTLTPPVLLFPANFSSGIPIDPLLQWSAVVGAGSYDVQVATDSLFANLSWDVPLVSTTSLQVPYLDYGATYYWRVRARNSGGEIGPYSTFWRFTTPPGIVSSYPVRQGWNVVSIPIVTGDPRKTSVFPTAISHAFSYLQGSGYRIADTLLNGLAFWIKFPLAQNVILHGLPIAADTLSVVSGWNFVGSITDAIDTAAILTVPTGIRGSVFFEYNGSYSISDSLRAGAGYWVKMNSPGVMILPSPLGQSLPGDHVLRKKE
jgi:hypothetical protein